MHIFTHSKVFIILFYFLTLKNNYLMLIFLYKKFLRILQTKIIKKYNLNLCQQESDYNVEGKNISHFIQ
jgi:hypothetical protein